MFLVTHFWFIVASAMISIIVLALASADKGQASFYLMLLTPITTIVHHAIVLFLPNYRPSHLDFEAPPKSSGLVHPVPPPTHTGRVYLAFLVLVSMLWSMSVMTTFYVVGFNVASEVKGIVRHTGPVECAFGIIEAGISWTIFVICLNQRVICYDGLPSA